MTKVTVLSQANQNSAGLVPLVLPTEEEMILFSDPRVKHWWRADAGFDATNKKWYCRKTRAALVPTRSAFPTRINAAGQVTAIAVSNGGANYTAAPPITIAAPPAGGIQAKAVATVAGGVVTGINVTHTGAGYTAAPAITIGGVGAGAVAAATISAGDKYNGNKCLMFDTGAGTNGALYDGGQNLLPTNDAFSVVVVGRQGPSNDVGAMWGNGVSFTSAGAGGIAAQWGTGSTFSDIQVSVSGTSVANSGNTGDAPYADGPYLHAFSLDEAGDTVFQAFYPHDFTQTLAKADALRVTNGEFHIGDDGPAGGVLSAAHYIEGGSIAECFIIRAALHLPNNADLLARLKSVLGARYAILTS